MLMKILTANRVWHKKYNYMCMHGWVHSLRLNQYVILTWSDNAAIINYFHHAVKQLQYILVILVAYV